MKMYGLRRGSLSAVLGLLVALTGCETQSTDIENELSVSRINSELTLELDWHNFRIVVDDEFEGPSGETVHYKWYEQIGWEDAYVIYLNGRGEFVEKYDPLFTANDSMPWTTTEEQTLADMNITFFALDHQGQGRSGGLGGHIESFDVYVENLRALIAHNWKLKNHIRPIYLMGHSTGALIAGLFAQRYPEYVDGLILSSPLTGIKPPGGLEPEQVRMLSMAYALPTPYGFGMAERCSWAPEAPAEVLGMIAQCLTDETGFCPSCFAGDRTAEGCDMIPVNWEAMDATWSYLNSEKSYGCQSPRTPEASCTFPGESFGGTTSDYDYCMWYEGHELASPMPTFGWMYQAFLAVDELNMAENLDVIRDIPTLVLSSPIDPLSLASSHGEFCGELNDCTLVEFHSDFVEGPIYFHELLAETNREAPIAAIRSFLEDRIY